MVAKVVEPIEIRPRQKEFLIKRYTSEKKIQNVEKPKQKTRNSKSIEFEFELQPKKKETELVYEILKQLQGEQLENENESPMFRKEKE